MKRALAAARGVLADLTDTRIPPCVYCGSVDAERETLPWDDRYVRCVVEGPCLEAMADQRMERQKWGNGSLVAPVRNDTAIDVARRR